MGIHKVLWKNVQTESLIRILRYSMCYICYLLNSFEDTDLVLLSC